MSDKSKRFDTPATPATPAIHATHAAHDDPDTHAARDEHDDDDHPEPRTATIWNGRHGSTLVGALCFGVLGLLIVFQVAC